MEIEHQHLNLQWEEDFKVGEKGVTEVFENLC